MDVLTKEQRRRNMQHIRANDTRLKLCCAKHCGKRGIQIPENL